MKKLNRKIIKRICVCGVLLALVLWLVPLPLPFHLSLSGARVEGGAAVESAALEVKGWRLCRFLREAELRVSFTVETAQKTETYEPVGSLGELTFPDGPIRQANGGWYDPEENEVVGLHLAYAADDSMAALRVGGKVLYAASAEPRTATEILGALRLAPDA